MRSTRVITTLLLAGVALPAANMDEFKRDCAAFGAAPALKPLVGCLSDFFTLSPIHPVIQSIVPGGGTGVGLNYKLDKPGDWHKMFTVSGAVSMRVFWKAETRMTLLHPVLATWNKDNEDQAVHFYFRARGLPQMPFYGIGNGTAKSALTDFEQRDLSFGGDASTPVTSWLGLGGVLEGIKPDINGIHSGSIRSIDTYFSEATAPGLSSQPTFAHSEVYAHIHHKYPFEFDGHVGYHTFATGNSNYSFQRFRAEVTHNIYPERINKRPKRDSVLSIHGVVSTSWAGKGDALPFYLQETLGGSDINGAPTLRGFADYRFRAPNLVLLQTQYERRIWQYVGVLGFYDAGQVAVNKGDLSFANMRQSFGFGISLWAESRVMFRMYVGLGSGEGIHNFFGIPAALP